MKNIWWLGNAYDKLKNRVRIMCYISYVKNYIEQPSTNVLKYLCDFCVMGLLATFLFSLFKKNKRPSKHKVGVFFYWNGYFRNGVFFCFFVLLFYLWLHWVFVAARGLSLVAASGGYPSLQCTGFSLRWLLLLQSTGSRPAGFSSCGLRALEHKLSSCGARA